MSETSSNDSPRFTRRTAIKGAIGLGAAAAAIAAIRNLHGANEGQPQEGPHEQVVLQPSPDSRSDQEIEIFQGELSCIAIKGMRSGEAQDKNNYRIERRDTNLARIADALSKGPADIVLTSEYGFVVPGYPLILRRSGSSYGRSSTFSWDVDPATSPFQQETVSRLKDLASTNKCSIFAATFNEVSENGMTAHNTLLHINKEGEILGIKRKGDYEPEGDFTVQKDGRKYKVLPIICGEISGENPITDGSGNITQVTIPSWIRKGAPYDVLIHPQEQADFLAGDLAAGLQRLPSAEPRTIQTFERAKQTFDAYYGPYRSVVKIGGPILTADLGISAVFSSDHRTLPEYDDTQNYSIAKVSR